MKRLIVCFSVSAIILTGCVSTKTYRAAFDESEARRAKLEKVSGELDAERKANEKLRKELEELAASKEKEISSLKARLDDLSSKGIMTSKEIADLREERERLFSSDKARAEELAALKTELAGRSKELGELREEKEKLLSIERARAEETASIRAELDSLTKDREYLSREVERLKVKAGEISSEKERELANVKSTYENLVREMKKEIEKGDIKITQAVDRLSVNLVEKILFDSGEAEIKPEGLKVIKRVGDILKGITDKQIRVEGHTDNVQIGAKIRKKYPTNWELSTARATNVVRYFQDKVGIDPKLLSVGGFSENKPVASNDTTEGRAQNRRIEIVLLPLDVDRVLQELKK